MVGGGGRRGGEEDEGEGAYRERSKNSGMLWPSCILSMTSSILLVSIVYLHTCRKIKHASNASEHCRFALVARLRMNNNSRRQFNCDIGVLSPVDLS